MRKLALAFLAIMSLSAHAESPCLQDALKKAPERVKTLAAEVLTIKAEMTLRGDTPYFTVDGEDLTSEERASKISEGYLVPGDMSWPVNVFIDKQTASENRLGSEDAHSIGFLTIRCKSATSSEVDSMWYVADEVAE
jgi:hypothetical protein